jgi:hypothetical protein
VGGKPQDVGRQTGQKFQIADPHNYVELLVTKSNYAAKLPAPIYFRRGAGGALAYVELGTERIEGIANKLLEQLAGNEAEGRHYSRRDLLYEKSAKPIADAIKETVPSFNRVRDINLAVDHLLSRGLLKETGRAGKTGPEKIILRVFEPAG